jgi:hypothetical protein
MAGPDELGGGTSPHADPFVRSMIEAAGDIIVGLGPERIVLLQSLGLPNGYVLAIDSTVAGGLAFKAPGAVVSGAIQRDQFDNTHPNWAAGGPFALSFAPAVAGLRIIFYDGIEDQPSTYAIAVANLSTVGVDMTLIARLSFYYAH